MRLKSIKVSGFKSFADLQSLELKTPLTAIVGPNGCGKSNIIDAVKWVIGESHAKNLRGDQISDVIFGGSFSRKAASQALVELTFDHSQKVLKGPFSHYDEIVVKRLIDREGHSAYWINSIRCRRKDVVDLFMGTGLGPRSYAIIEQGTINRFIEAKPTDLIGYIEEAAGISRYYEKRKETIAHIEESQDNLSRACDLEKELKKRCDILGQQASEARAYQDIREKIIQTRQQYFAVSYRESCRMILELQAKKQDVETQIHDQKSYLEDLKKNCARFEKDLQIEQHLFNQLKDDLYLSQKHLQDLKNHYDQTEMKLTWADQSLSASIEEIASSASMLVSIDLKHFSKNRTLQPQVMEILHENMEQSKNCVDEKKILYHQTQHQHDLAKKNLYAQKEVLNKTQWQVQHLTNKFQEEQALYAKLQKEHDDLKASLEHLIAQMTEHDLNVYDSQICDTQKSLVELKNSYKQTQISIQDLKTHFAIIKKDRDRTVSILSELQHSIDAHHRLKSHWLSGIDNVRIVDPQSWKYDLAYYQSQPTQYFFKGSVAPTRAMIEQVADLDLEYSWGDSAPPYWENFIFTDCLEYALENVQNLSAEKAFLLPGGMLLGHGWIRPLRKRSTTLADLEQQMLSQKDTLQDYQIQIDRIESQLTEAISLQRTLDEQLSVTEINLKRLETQKHQEQMQLSLKKQKIASLQEHCSKIEMQIMNHSQKQQTLFAQISASTEEEKLFLEKIALLQDVMLEAQHRLDSISLEYQNVQKIYQDLQSQYYEKKSLEEIAKNEHDYALKEYEKEKKRWKTAMLSYAKALKEKDQHIQSRDQFFFEIQKLQPQIERDQAQIASGQKQIDSLAQEYKAAEKNLKHQLFSLHSKEDSLRSIQSDLEKNIVILETIQEQILDQGLLLAQLDSIQSSQSAPSLKKNMQVLEKELEDLGPVNLKALQEFESQSQRYKDIVAQRTDLEQATEQLKVALNDLDKQMEDLFNQTYSELQKNFTHLFGILFSGGQGKLEIEMNERGERGLVIQAQPPGKKTHRLAMLSGGEKALTAAALVFSFFQLNPAPFCLLDEIDAPLDDANTERLAKLIHQFQATVQFIIVTHSQVMMSQVDSLYGVTMKEPGISRFVSVHLQEALYQSMGAEKNSFKTDSDSIVHCN